MLFSLGPIYLFIVLCFVILPYYILSIHALHVKNVPTVCLPLALKYVKQLFRISAEVTVLVFLQYFSTFYSNFTFLKAYLT